MAAPVARPSPFPPRRVLALGFPLALGMGGHAAFNLVDLWIVAPLGPAALAAVGVASLVNAVPMVACQGVADGAAAGIARRFGAGDARGAALAARGAVLLALAMAVLLGVPPWLAAGPLARAAGASGAALEPASACLGILSLGSGTMFVLMIACAALRAAGYGRAPAILILGSNTANAILSYALVHGAWGLPALGVAGAPWGTVIARGVAAVAAVAVIGATPLAFRWRGGGPGGAFTREVLAFGIPVAAQWGVRVVAVLVVLAVAGRHGSAAQAAYGAAGRLDTLALFTAVGWGSAAATAVAQGIGAGHPRCAVRGAWTGAALAAGTMALFAAAYLAEAPRMIRWIGGGGEGVDPAGVGALVATGADYLRAVAWVYPAMGVSVVLSMSFAAAGRVRGPLAWEAAVLLGVQVPLVLGTGEDLGGAWTAVAVAHAILAAGYAVAFARGAGRWSGDPSLRRRTGDG